MPIAGPRVPPTPLEELEDELRANFLPYSRQAWAMLPPVEDPRILDLGCGSGVVTVELASISGGAVTAVDVDERALSRLERRLPRLHQACGADPRATRALAARRREIAEARRGPAAFRSFFLVLSESARTRASRRASGSPC